MIAGGVYWLTRSPVIHLILLLFLLAKVVAHTDQFQNLTNPKDNFGDRSGNSTAEDSAADSGDSSEDNSEESSEDSSEDCGLAPAQQGFRIADGHDGKPGQFPSFVSMIVRTKDSKLSSGICGGTIIGKKHILSAAHCFKEKQISQVIITSHINGVSNALMHHRGEIYDAEKVCITGKYREHKLTGHQSISVNDLAILQLRKPLNFSDTIQPACLPKSELTGSGIVVGSGKTSYINLATNLQYTRATTVACPFNDTSDSILCVQRESKADGRLCKGDSGGPLYMTVDGRFTAIGGVSFGQALCKADDSLVMLADYYKLRHEIKRLLSVCEAAKENSKPTGGK